MLSKQAKKPSSGSQYLSSLCKYLTVMQKERTKCFLSELSPLHKPTFAKAYLGPPTFLKSLESARKGTGGQQGAHGNHTGDLCLT